MTATRIILFFNLKEGVSRDDYEAWARTRDLPSVRALPSIARFDVLRSTPCDMRDWDQAPALADHVTTGLGAWQNAYFAVKTRRSVEQYLADMTARIPMGRAGLSEDTAAVPFLASDEARYSTAACLNVSGGEEPH